MKLPTSIKWTHFLRGFGVAILGNEFFLRAAELPERGQVILAALAMIGLHEVVKRDEKKQ